MENNKPENIGACPEWCDDEHEQGNLPADQRHLRDFPTVPVVMRTHRLGDQPQSHAANLNLLLFQHPDECETWVTFGDDRYDLSLTIESAKRLRDRLTELLSLVVK